MEKRAKIEAGKIEIEREKKECKREIVIGLIRKNLTQKHQKYVDQRTDQKTVKSLVAYYNLSF